jgi:hypothetical protein
MLLGSACVSAGEEQETRMQETAFRRSHARVEVIQIGLA